jgi:hypothetical protein
VGRIVAAGSGGVDVCMSSIVCCGRESNVGGAGVYEDEIDRAGEVGGRKERNSDGDG